MPRNDGKPLPKLTEKQIHYFWRKISIGAPNECWPWRGGKDKDGYGKTILGYGIIRVHIRPHRIAHMLKHGDAGALCVLHACDNPPCCNPAHLFAGTNTQNMADRNNKGRQASGDRSGLRVHPERAAKGMRNANAKLNDEAVRTIRKLYAGGNWSQERLGRLFNVHQTIISDVVRLEHWKHVS